MTNAHSSYALLAAEITRLREVNRELIDTLKYVLRNSLVYEPQGAVVKRIEAILKKHE